MLNILSKVLGSKFRLYLEYFLVGSSVALGAVAFTLYFQRNLLRKDVSALQKDVKIHQVLINSQKIAIQEVELHRQADAKVVDHLIERIDQVGIADKKIHADLATLERSNDAVKSYLANPVPASLACVLTNTCASDSTAVRHQGDSTVAPTPAVRPADTGAASNHERPSQPHP